MLALTAAAPSSASSRSSAPALAQLAGSATICEHANPDLCWRDPSEGGPGTPVVTSAPGTEKARQWSLVQDTSRCGGFVSEALACPFTPGSGAVLGTNLCSCGARYVNGGSLAGEQLTIGPAGPGSKWG